MLYFIPSWYRQGEWSENEEVWHVERTHSEFDDTVKQIQLYHRNGTYPYAILLLSYAPNFRHFLHRQGLFRAPYWSCFDAIQEIRRKKVGVFSYHNLDWPEGIEYVYTPFSVLALRNRRKYAQMEFGEDGNLILVEMFKKNRLYRKNLYDDRGFVSCTILYEDGVEHHRDYLMEDGTWKLRCYGEDGRVEINPEHPYYLIQYGVEEHRKQFLNQTYENLEEVIEEVLQAYVELTNENDIFCVAMHERHVKLTEALLNKRKTILSFFEDRYCLDEHPQLLPMLFRADYVVLDVELSEAERQSLPKQLQGKIMGISPYDTRVDLGVSSQLSVQKILVPVDGLEETRFEQVILLLADYITKNDKVQIHLFTRVSDYDIEGKILEKTRRALMKGGYDMAWTLEGRQMEFGENDLYGEIPPTKFFVEKCVDERFVSRCMREQRLIVDVRNTPELYLQITAISMGIPQIVARKTQFIEHEANGKVIKNLDELTQSLQFYLDELSNWNEAKVASFELVKRFSTEALLEKWKEVLRIVG